MPRKIHMQDQVFNNVEQIMSHFQRTPLKVIAAGINRMHMSEVKDYRYKFALKSAH